MVVVAAVVVVVVIEVVVACDGVHDSMIAIVTATVMS